MTVLEFIDRHWGDFTYAFLILVLLAWWCR